MIGYAMLFDEIPRHDCTPCGHAEGMVAFLNRSGSEYFGSVRDVIEEWFSHIPVAAQADLRGALRADGRQADSAFWELYLHEAYLRSGYSIEIHPELPNHTTHPDFRMTRGGELWYLEAVGVGQATSEISEDRRLSQVHQVLAELKVKNFGLELSTYSIGRRPLSTKPLRSNLIEWLATLDVDEVTEAAESSTAVGFDRLPSMNWNVDGWHLVFHALPRVEAVRGIPLSALGILGPGEATIVDNATGIKKVLSLKHGRYGELDGPLVVAVLSNTEYRTKDYEIEQALYGVSAYRPSESLQHPEGHFEDGFWLTKRGWRYADTPQVVTASDLKPWTITRTQPRLWQTLQPGVSCSIQPEWLARMEIANEAIPGPAISLASHFGLAPDWPGMDEPDFDVLR
jgi:hypothetical protein